MAAITDLAAASSVAATDNLVINQGGTDRKVTADKFAVLGLANTFAAGQNFRGRVGLTATKSGIAHNTAVQSFTLTMSAYGIVTGAYLVTLVASGTGRLATQTYIVTIAYSTVTVTKLSEALFGFTSLALYSSINTSTGVITFSTQHVNPGSEVAGVNCYVLPLSVSSDGLVALAAL